MKIEIENNKEFIHLLTERLTVEEVAKYPTIGDAKERLSQILGRQIWAHELAYPKFLIGELLGNPTNSSFESSTEELKKRMPVITAGQ